MNKRETDTLCNSIKMFGVKVVLVIDYEKLEKDIQTFLKANRMEDVHVIKVPKSPGIQSQPRLSSDEVSQLMFNAYQDYFRGKYHDLYLKTTAWREELQMPAFLRRELDPQPQSLILEKVRIFEVKGHEVPLSALPAGSLQSEWTTIMEEIRPSDFEKNFATYRYKVMANLVPRDLDHLRQLEQRMAQNPQSAQLKEDHKNMLLSAATSEFIQVREIKLDISAQKKVVDVVRTCQSRADPLQAGDD